jgi:hypothetical protein
VILGGGPRENGVKWRVSGCLDATERRAEGRDQETNKSCSSSDYMEKVHFDALDSRISEVVKSGRFLGRNLWEVKDESVEGGKEGFYSWTQKRDHKR